MYYTMGNFVEVMYYILSTHFYVVIGFRHGLPLLPIALKLSLAKHCKDHVDQIYSVCGLDHPRRFMSAKAYLFCEKKLSINISSFFFRLFLQVWS